MGAGPSTTDLSWLYLCPSNRIGLSIPPRAVQAESCICPGVLEPHCTILALLWARRDVTSTCLGKTYDTAHMPSLARLELPTCSQRALQALYLGAVRWGGVPRGMSFCTHLGIDTRELHSWCVAASRKASEEGKVRWQRLECFFHSLASLG